MCLRLCGILALVLMSISSLDALTMAEFNTTTEYGQKIFSRIDELLKTDEFKDHLKWNGTFNLTNEATKSATIAGITDIIRIQFNINCIGDEVTDVKKKEIRQYLTEPAKGAANMFIEYVTGEKEGKMSDFIVAIEQYYANVLFDKTDGMVMGQFLMNTPTSTA